MKRGIPLLLLIFIGCSRPKPTETGPASAGLDVDSLAEKTLFYMIVEHEPDEYSRDVQQEIKDSLPGLVKSYKECSLEKADRLERNVEEFLRYEASQYDDVCQWYAKLSEAVASNDANLLARMKSAKVISDRTRSLTATLPARVKKFAEDQMKGAEQAPAQLWSAIPPGGSLPLSVLQAGQSAAAKFDASRKQSYSRSYRQITGKDLSTR